MNSGFKIKSFINIRNGIISFNNTILFEDDANNFKDFIKKAYKSLDIDYPKFFKMDNLSKLAFVAADVLLNNINIDENTAVILSNRSSSLDTDRKHQTSISDAKNYYPSPSVFVFNVASI